MRLICAWECPNISVFSEKKTKNTSQKLNESDKKNIKKMIKTFSIKDIVNLISKDKEISKKEIYNFCLSLKNENQNY